MLNETFGQVYLPKIRDTYTHKKKTYHYKTINSPLLSESKTHRHCKSIHSIIPLRTIKPWIIHKSLSG